MSKPEVNPEFSDFPLCEYELRYKRIQHAMQEKSIDLLMFTQRENVEYFSGFMTTHWIAKGFSPGVALFPKRGVPVLVVPSFLRYTAEKTSWVQDIKTQERTHARPREFAHSVMKSIREMGYEQGIIGIETGPELHIQMPMVDFDNLRSMMHDANFVSGADAIWETRMIKSPLELERIKIASEITIKAFEKMFNALKKGMTEREVARFIATAMIEEGADQCGFTNIRAGSERYSMADTYPQERRIRQGDMIVVDAGAIYRGYWTDLARVALVGSPSEKHRRLYNIILKAEEAGIRRVRPGVTASEVYNSVMNIIKESTTIRALDMCGHGIGLDVHEPPMISDGQTQILKPGMVINVEAWLYDISETGVLAVEDMIVVTDNGCLMLTPFERDRLLTINA